MRFAIMNGFVAPATAKKRKVQATGEDAGRAQAEFFDSLVNKASEQELGAWLIELAVVQHRAQGPYSQCGDSPKPDPLFEIATRWGLDVESITAAVAEQPKPKRKTQKHIN